VLHRAAALASEGDLRLACHLVEFAVMAEPGSQAAHALRREIYQARAGRELASMARNIFAHAARASGEGRRDTTGSEPGGA
jgi:alkyl sulfatase BDS1-like metallo-beta-lactamase superfamily hydrolase